MSKIGNINIDVFLSNITLEELEFKEVSVNGSPQYGFIISRKRTPPQEISFLIKCTDLGSAKNITSNLINMQGTFQTVRDQFNRVFDRVAILGVKSSFANVVGDNSFSYLVSGKAIISLESRDTIS
jgi:hypothetical protein